MFKKELKKNMCNYILIRIQKIVFKIDNLKATNITNYNIIKIKYKIFCYIKFNI